jgi:hypothetical protein
MAVYIRKGRYVNRQNLSKRYEEYMLMLPGPLLQPNETDSEMCDDPRGGGREPAPGAIVCNHRLKFSSMRHVPKRAH